MTWSKHATYVAILIASSSERGMSFVVHSGVRAISYSFLDFFIVSSILTLSGILTVRGWLLCACKHLLSVVTLEHYGFEIGGGSTYVYRRGIRPLGGRTGAALLTLTGINPRTGKGPQGGLFPQPSVAG